MFSRQFRMHRDLFFRLLRRMIYYFPGSHSEGEKNFQHSCCQGDNAHGHHILLQIKLCITLRILAGASYLDMIWYGVSIGYVETIFKDCLSLIHRALPDDYIFDFNERTDFNRMAHEWSQIMIRRRSHDLMKGTILAGDGLVIEIQGGTEEDRGGLDPAAFRNRKGFFAVIVQAFCDAFCMFRYFEISWPGSTPDITAYKQTELFRTFMQGVLNDYHMVLDEAYSSIGGDQHLTPFSKHQLRRALAKSQTLYCQMKTFNNILSGQRITIERAFGMLVRKWGILWRPLSYKTEINTKIVIVCAKLHNFCIMDWKRRGGRSEEVRNIELLYSRSFQDTGVFMGFDDDRNEFIDADTEPPNDDAVMRIMRNTLHDGQPAAQASDRKLKLMRNMFECGLRYDVSNDTGFVDDIGGR
jgi:hypothetical protein